MSISVEIEEQGRAKRTVEIDLAVCILFYEKLDQTIECIQSFLPSGVNIYILNNDSSSSARQALERFCDNYKQIKIFDSDVNLGVGVGRNYLATHTTEEWLLFVDSDITIKTPDWLQKFAQHVLRYPDIEVFIPRLFNIHENRYVSYCSFRIRGWKIHGVEIINDLTNTFPGGASFINRRLFDRLGLYDDKMFVGFEDYELCIRGIRLGNPVKARLIHDIELVHDHRQAKKSEDKKAVLTRYDVRLHEASSNRITEKHNILFGSDWKNWVINQVEITIKKRSHTFNSDWKQWFPHQAKRILRQSTKMAIFFASFILPYQVKNILKTTLHLTHMPVPHSCSLYMIDTCNFKCPGCYRSVMGIKKPKEMTLATVQKLLSLYPSLDAFCVTGLGEPTLCSNFVDIVNFLKKNRKFVGIRTNGTNLDKFLELTYEPNYIVLSLKGYDNKSYLTNTGVDAFDTVMETFSKLKLRFKNVGFSYMLNRTNYKDLDKVLSLCDDIKPEFLYLTNYWVYNPSIPEEIQKIITIKDTEIIDHINDICAGREYIRVKPIYVDFDNPKFNCKSYDYIINLDGEGNISGCQRQIPPDASFGNIFRDKDPYNSLKMCKMREQMHKRTYPHNECRFCFVNWEP